MIELDKSDSDIFEQATNHTDILQDVHGFYDPFADTPESEFDPENVFNQIVQNYHEQKVTHDDAADTFVARTEALMMDAVFVQRFDVVQSIAAQMHMMCGEDHNVQAQVEANSFLFNSMHNSDGHTHAEQHQQHGEDTHLDEDYEWVIVNGKRVKRKKKRK